MLYTGVTYGAVHHAQSRARSARAPTALRSCNILGGERKEQEHPSTTQERGRQAGGRRDNAGRRRGGKSHQLPVGAGHLSAGPASGSAAGKHLAGAVPKAGRCSLFFFFFIIFLLFFFLNERLPCNIRRALQLALFIHIPTGFQNTQIRTSPS